MGIVVQIYIISSSFLCLISIRFAFNFNSHLSIKHHSLYSQVFTDLLAYFSASHTTQDLLWPLQKLLNDTLGYLQPIH